MTWGMRRAQKGRSETRMQRLLHSVERLARLAQRDAGVPAVQRALAEELVAALGLDQAHVIVLSAGHAVCGAVARRGRDAAEYVLRPDDGPGALRWVAEAGQAVTVADAH